MSKEEMREGFEAWHCEQYKTKHTTGEPTRDMHNGIRDEDYCSKKSQALWECWQATGGDMAKVESLKDEIERIELGKQPLMHIHLNVLEQLQGVRKATPGGITYSGSNPVGGLTVPLFTRAETDEAEQLRESYVAAGEREHALRKELARLKPTKIESCKECGSKSLSWFATNANTSGVQEGRLRTSEVTCQFVLGCDECSETLKVVSADAIANFLSAALSTSTEPANKESAQ